MNESNPPDNWIPVTERLPALHEEVLTWEYAIYELNVWYGEPIGWDSGGEPTHWMPLPRPPVNDPNRG